MIANVKIDLTGKKLILQTADSYGNYYKLPIQILRSSSHRDGMLCGARFDIVNEENFQQIISYVYGDSQRLKYFHQARTERTLNTFKGFLNLNKIGVRGTIRNLRGLVKIALNTIGMIVTQSLLRMKVQRRISTS
jgi:hypothetical protein